MMKRARQVEMLARLAASFLVSAMASSFLGASTLRVPGDFPTIKSAVNNARQGDLILVDDGVYPESNIIVDKDITLRARNLLGAVIYGSQRPGDAILIIRAAPRIEGFVLRNGDTAIIQRDSFDVEWKASNLMISGFNQGIAINDAKGNIGSAVLESIVMLDTWDGISTNDARSMDISRSFIMNCKRGVQGYNHLAFQVRETAFVDCLPAVFESTDFGLVPPATSTIDIDPSVRIIESRPGSKTPAGSIKADLALIRSLLENSIDDRRFPSENPDRARQARKAVLALMEGIFSHGRGAYDSSLSSYREAAEAAARAKSPEFEWQALIARARLEKERGAVRESIESYRAAISFIDGWLPLVPKGIFRSNFFEDKLAAYEALIGLLLDVHNRDPAGHHDEAAFLFSEKSRSFGLFELGGRTGYPPSPRQGRDSPRAGTDAAAAISALQMKLQDPALSAGEKDEFRVKLMEAEEALHGFFISREHEPQTPGKAALGRGTANRTPADSQGLSELRRRLEGRAVLSYFLGQEESYAFLVTGAGLGLARLPGARTIQSNVETYLKYLQIDNIRDFNGWRGGKILFDLLVGPFAAGLAAGPREIVIVPDGHLHYLPFEALVEEVGPEVGTGRFWIETRTLSYAGSAMEALASGKASGFDLRNLKLFAVGYSGRIRHDNRAAKMAPTFLPLGHAEREVMAVAKFFGPARAKILTGSAAAESRVKEARLSEYDILHFATHGIIDDENWWRSSLLLEAGEGSGEDGLLTALEISEINLRAQLVVLSACGTGLGSLYRGEGIVGLAMALLGAGARGVVVSLWSVDDRMTAKFMMDFYGEMARGILPAEALARAKAGMIKAGHGNPYLWAPFVYIGQMHEVGAVTSR